MRKGEVQHLHWDDVSFELGVIFISGKEDWRPTSLSAPAKPKPWSRPKVKTTKLCSFFT